MKTAFQLAFVLFFFSISFSSFSQSFIVESVTKGEDFSQYSNSGRNSLERIIGVIKNSNITVTEGDLAIVRIKDGGMNFIFRFFRSANMLAMSQEEYLKVKEFHGTSNFIDGINYLEMSVDRHSDNINSGEIRFYPDKGYSKPVFIAKFSKPSTNLSNNLPPAPEDDSKQRLLFVNIDHVPEFDYESLNELTKDLSESVIELSEAEYDAYIEITKNDGEITKWEFSRILTDEGKTDEFITVNAAIPKKMVLKRYSGKVNSVQIGYYKKENLLKGGASLIIYLSASKNQFETYEEIRDREIQNEAELKSQEDSSINEKINKEALIGHGISYSLGGRSAQTLPLPYHPGNEEGVVVVQVTVDKNGTVTKAVSGARGSTTLLPELLAAAQKAAMISKFNLDNNAPAFQQGTITYRFVLD